MRNLDTLHVTTTKPSTPSTPAPKPGNPETGKADFYIWAESDRPKFTRDDMTPDLVAYATRTIGAYAGTNDFILKAKDYATARGNLSDGYAYCWLNEKLRITRAALTGADPKSNLDESPETTGVHDGLYYVTAAGDYTDDTPDPAGESWLKVKTATTGKRHVSHANPAIGDHYYGRVGNLLAGTGKTADALRAIATNPGFHAAEFGKRLDHCGACGRPLTSEWRHKGIGPECSKKTWTP